MEKQIKDLIDTSDKFYKVWLIAWLWLSLMKTQALWVKLPEIAEQYKELSGEEHLYHTFHVG